MLIVGGFMKKTIKLISILISILIMTTLFVSCSSDELTLLDTLSKQNNITSMENKMEITLKLEASGMSAKDQQAFQQVSAMLNDSKILIDQKTKSNQDKTSSQAQADVTVNMGGIGVSTNIWVNADLSGAKPKMREIIKIPSMLAGSLPAEYQGKQYLFLDVDQVLTSSSTVKFDYKKLLNFSKDVTPKVFSFLKDYFTQFNPGFDILTHQADKTVDGQTLSMYELKLDDKTFKSLIDYGVDNFLSNEKALSFSKELILSIIDISGVTGAEKTKALTDLNKAFADMKTGMPAFKEQWSKVMTVLKDVQLLGDKGIRVEFGINKAGYIVSEAGTIDLSLDLKAIADAGENINLLQDSKYTKKISTQQGLIKIGIDFHNQVSKINEDIAITFPTLTPQNSFSLMDTLNSFIPKAPTKEIAPKDTKAPVAPIVNKVLHTAKSVTGKAEIGSIIVIKNGKTIIGTNVTNTKGIFSVKILAQKLNSKLVVTAMDKSGNISKATTVIVK